MRYTRRPLWLETLEDRTVPSLTTNLLYNGSLYLSGVPKGELVITHMGANASTFQVKDNGSSIGTFNILQDLDINLTYRSSDIKIDLSDGRIPGNVLINLGNGLIGAGTTGVSVYDDHAAPTGRISGSVTVLGGNGHESIDIGSIFGVGTPAPVTINGNLTVASSLSSGAVGNTVIVDAGTRVGGSVTITLMSSVTIGSMAPGAALTSIGQNLTISDAGSLRPLSATVTAGIGGSLNVSGTVLDDSFALQPVAALAGGIVAGSGTVGGSLSVNLYTGLSNGDSITLGDNTQVNGSAFLTAGGNFLVNPDQFKIGGSVNGNLTVSMGSGLNSLTLSQQTTGDPAPFVGGNMIVTAGNGDNTINFVEDIPLDTAPIIGGSLSITLGGGDNMALIAASVGGTIRWRSGNGQDSLQLGNNTADGYEYAYSVNIVFGNDDDTLTVDIGTNPPDVLNGFADGGGRVTFNTFNLISGTLAPTFVLVNFP